MNDIVRGTNRTGETIGRCSYRVIAGPDQWQVCVPGCLRQMLVNRLDREGAGDLACIPAAHAVTDDIESEQWVDYEAIFIVGSFEAGIGFGAMQCFEGQTTPLSGREFLQTGTEFVR